MHQPRLHSSQELTLHQINVEQSYRSRERDGLPFPSSPLASYPQLGLSTGATHGSDPLSLAGVASPVHGGGTSTPLTQTPGGSSSTATASIVRPDVRHRPEWAAALDDVEPYGLPGDHFLCSNDGAAVTPVRYIADDYDRQWLAQRLDQYGSDLDGGARGHGGKTGMAGSPAAWSPQAGRDIGVSLLEDAITAFELAAYLNPEIPLERLSSVDALYLEEVPASAAIIGDVRHYWLRKRESLGGLIPCIPALKPAVREDNQTALCHPDILGDCPLPFKWRDWTVSVVKRKRSRAESNGHERDDVGTRRANLSPRTVRGNGSCADYQRFADVALALSAAALQRERTRREHTHLCLYELACLRGVGDHVLAAPQMESQPRQANDDESFAHLGDSVPAGVRAMLAGAARDKP